MSRPQPVLPAPLAPLAPDAWRRLSARRVYFGHQSVGQNIVDGIADLVRNRREATFRAVELGDGPLPEGGALLHSRLGANTDPMSKFRAFEEVLRGPVGRWATVAMLKLCYADVHAGTDVQRLLDEQMASIDRLGRELPSVRVVAVTVPVTALPPWPKRAAKAILGKPVREFGDNARRAEYNDELRARLGGGVFDVARIEATRPDGRPERDGTAMYAGYTSDRGHLNATGRLVVAEALLRYLAELSA